MFICKSALKIHIIWLFGYVEVTAMQPLRRFFKKGGAA